MRALVVVLALVGCYKDPQFRDCEYACTDSCPGNLMCVAGACREPGVTGACMVQPGVDAAADSAGPDAPPAVDTDQDGIPDSIDNCPTKPNHDQANEDGDAWGDACDLCPIFASSVDSDADSDGVGDACDPNKNTAGEQMILFEPFNGTSMPTGSTSFNGTWQFSGGKASVNASGTVPTKLVWLLTAGHQTIYTRVTMTHSSTPAYAGVTNVANSAVGVSCLDHVDPTLITNLQLTDGSTSPTTAANSGFTEGSADALALVRVNSTSWSCQRVGGPTINSMYSAGGPNVGIFAEQATATFDYVMIVNSP